MKRVALFILLLAVAAIGVWKLSKARSFQLFGETITRVDVDAPLVALTLDDGPWPLGTAETLEILAEHDVPATFFLIGNHMADFPELTREIIAAGHEVGNHSYTHDRMILRSKAWVEEQLQQTDSVLRTMGYQGPIQFRPPYGQKLVILPWVLSRENRPSIMWDVAPDVDTGAPAELANAIIAQAAPGSIILMHTMYRHNETSREALPLVIDGLQAKGFELVTLSDLLAAWE